MRTQLVLPNSLSLRLFATGWAALAVSSLAHGTPVYLSPTSLFSSGQYARDNLERRTVETLTQRWLRLRTVGGRIGWAPEDMLIAHESKVFALKDDLPLRSAPLPFADVTATLRAGTVLKRIGEGALRWGRVPTDGRRVGHRWSRADAPSDFWWPMTDGFGDDEGRAPRAGAERLTTEALFKRKIFDAATSPARANLQFVSAGGLFRTVDGQTWRRIPELKNANFPLSIAKSGAIFAGPYASDDDGETFQQFVKWDALVDAIKFARKVDPERLKILEARPLDRTGERLRLHVDIGRGAPVAVLTEDRGTTWVAD